MTFCYIRRPVSCSLFVREASFSQYVLTTIGAIFEKLAECMASFMSHFVEFSEPLEGIFTLLYTGSCLSSRG